MVKLCPVSMIKAHIQNHCYNHPFLVTHLFQLKGKPYLEVVDYYSKYNAIIILAAVVTSLKAIFLQHGILVTFVSNNGPQFNSEEMRRFAKEYAFQHTTSSP